ncbi:uncharacterized protein LOC144382897 [Halichoerus grypus]
MRCLEACWGAGQGAATVSFEAIPPPAFGSEEHTVPPVTLIGSSTRNFKFCFAELSRSPHRREYFLRGRSGGRAKLTTQTEHWTCILWQLPSLWKDSFQMERRWGIVNRE